ncbi:MAG: hypothetical protein ACK5GN_05720 [Pseudomonadota bacterium]
MVRHRYVAIAAVAFLAIGATGCGCCGATKSEVVKPTLVEYRVQDVPGAVEYIWEEPMVDVVDVPPGLDPEGHYYRPGHQEVVEIRQGKWQYYKRPQQ